MSDSRKKVNKEGLTWNEWADAAGVSRKRLTRGAWLDGEDPTEYRAAREGTKKEVRDGLQG